MSILKTWLLWLLMLFLPLQGTAASMNAVCGLECTPSSAAPSPVASSAFQPMQMPATHARMQDAAIAADHDADCIHAHGTGMQGHPCSTAGCGMCVYCGGAVIGPTQGAPLLPQHGYSAAAFPAASILAESFIASGLDRPPKPISL